MTEIKSKSDKRLIVEGLVNDQVAYFLMDTGASVSLIDKNQRKDYDLLVGGKYNGSIIGAGGSVGTTHICNTFVNIGGKLFAQFLLTDIESIVDSIEHETGIRILGIIGLPQMKFNGIIIDINDDMIIIE